MLNIAVHERLPIMLPPKMLSLAQIGVMCFIMFQNLVMKAPPHHPSFLPPQHLYKGYVPSQIIPSYSHSLHCLSSYVNIILRKQSQLFVGISMWAFSNVK